METFRFMCQGWVKVSSEEAKKKIFDDWKNSAPPEVKLEKVVFQKDDGRSPGSVSEPPWQSK